MLITKPRAQLDAAYVREFCRKFNEGFRVEYKADLSGKVRDSLPKIISSFANHYGGVLIVGVCTEEGKAVEPIEGFDKPGREELPLTIENSCLANIYPTLTPLATEVASDVPGKIFLIVEVDASPEAPHAIENSRKVFVRTGSASKPYDLADLDLLERIIKRRDKVLQVRQEFVADADALFRKFGNQTSYPKVRIVIGPRFPHSTVADREQVFQYLRDTRFRGGHFYRVEELRRMPRGACGTRGNIFGYLDVTGHLLHQEVPECSPSYLVSDLVHPILQAISCAYSFYQLLGHSSDTLIEVRAFDLVGHACIDRRDYTDDVFEPSVETITAEYHAASERLWHDVLPITTSLVHQLLWPMKQGLESVKEGQVRWVVERVLSAYHP